MPFRTGALFAGYGGLELAVNAFFGAQTVWVSEIDSGACRILAHHWPEVPNLGDITRIDWSSVEPIDILTGGFPCQDLSTAGKRVGLKPGTRSGLWTHMTYAIQQLRPRYVVAENVRGLLSAPAHSDLEFCPWCVGGAADGEPVLRALGAVLGDLAQLGYDARWHGLRAADVGAPHGRFRIFIVAHRRDAALDTGRLSERLEITRERPGASGHRIPGHLHSNNAHHVESAAAVANANTSSDTRRLIDRDDYAAWGSYDAVIRRWAERLGQPVPAPMEMVRLGRHRLSSRFVEWMMGLPVGHVSQVPGLSRVEQLHALGNGVVPQQAYEALSRMLIHRPTCLHSGNPAAKRPEEIHDVAV